MHRSARTAHTIRPSRSGSSTMQLATGQAAWQIEQANAPKQRSGSITAMVFGAFLRAPAIILVHMLCGIIRDYLSVKPDGGSPNSGIAAHSDDRSSQMELPALTAKYLLLLAMSSGSAAALNACPVAPTP